MIKSQITLKQLEAFVGVVDLGSFRKAASVLGTTQPNISNRISTLEETLGVILLHRDAGSVRQTEKGAALLAIARQILWNAEAFLEAAERQDLVDDRLRLGVTELIACTWLHRFLRRFREVYPSVSVELEVGLTGEIEKKLATGQIDLALQTGSFDREAGRTIHLQTYPYIWVAAPTLAEANGTNRSMVNLLKGPVLTHGRNTVASKELARYAEAKRLASCVQMTVDGMGFALLPAALVRDQLQSQSLVQIDIEWHPSPLEFYARFNPKRVPLFVEVAAGFAAEIANSGN